MDGTAQKQKNNKAAMFGMCGQGLGIGPAASTTHPNRAAPSYEANGSNLTHHSATAASKTSDVLLFREPLAYKQHTITCGAPGCEDVAHLPVRVPTLLALTCDLTNSQSCRSSFQETLSWCFYFYHPAPHPPTRPPL